MIFEVKRLFEHEILVVEFLEGLGGVVSQRFAFEAKARPDGRIRMRGGGIRVRIREARITVCIPPVEPLGLVEIRPVGPPSLVEGSGDDYEFVKCEIRTSVFLRAA